MNPLVGKLPKEPPSERASVGAHQWESSRESPPSRSAPVGVPPWERAPEGAPQWEILCPGNTSVNWPCGITVSMLDSESSDRGSLLLLLRQGDVG